MKTPVGYLVNTPDGVIGEKGLYYNYILGANGLFIEAENAMIAARVPVALGEVRGLVPVETKVSLTYGSIPRRFFDLALDVFLADPDNEQYVAVTASAGYHFYTPVQNTNGTSVVYEVGDAVILDLHSHGPMKAFFSSQDDRDENGLKLYGVVGSLRSTPVIKLRIGVYGYFKTLSWVDVFDGVLTGALEFEDEEVKTIDDIHCNAKAYADEFQYPGRRLWWDRGLRC